jgi:hypothetical protein
MSGREVKKNKNQKKILRILPQEKDIPKLPEEEKEKEEQFSVKKEGSTYWFKISSITYRVADVKEIFASRLKVSVKASKGEEYFCATIDLYSFSMRENYCLRFSRMAEAEPEKVEKDLLKILEYLEKERDERIALSSLSPSRVRMSEEEKKLGIKFLESSNLFDQIDRDMSALGYISEKENKLIVYLAAVSRFLPSPLNVYIQADSAGGKSALLNTLEKMLPPEDVWKALSISPQALHYVDEERFLGKVFMMGESLHDEAVEGLVRQMQSEGEISRLVTMKDEKTGEMKARLLSKKVRMSFMITSTALYLNPENASRCLMLYADESPEQTVRIQKRLGEGHDFKGKVIDSSTQEMIVKKHTSAQRLLRPVDVFNPLWKYIKFPTKRPSMRRTYDQFLTLIDSVCFLRQRQKKEIKRINPVTEKEAAGIECDISDYRISYKLFTHAVLKRGMSDIPTGTHHLWEALRTMVRKKAKERNLKVHEVSFINRQVREFTGLGAEFLKKHLRLLTDYEYLQVIGGMRHGTRYSYRLREDAPLEELDISMIPAPEKLKEMMSKEK